MHPQEVVLTPANVPTLMEEAANQGPKYIQALKEQVKRQTEQMDNKTVDAQG